MNTGWPSCIKLPGHCAFDQIAGGCCSKVDLTQSVPDVPERSLVHTCQTLKLTSGRYEACQYAPARHREGTRFSPEISPRMFQTCRASRRKHPPSASSRHMRSRERTYAVLQGTIDLGRFPVCPFRISGSKKRQGILCFFRAGDAQCLICRCGKAGGGRGGRREDVGRLHNHRHHIQSCLRPVKRRHDDHLNRPRHPPQKP